MPLFRNLSTLSLAEFQLPLFPLESRLLASLLPPTTRCQRVSVAPHFSDEISTRGNQSRPRSSSSSALSHKVGVLLWGFKPEVLIDCRLAVLLGSDRDCIFASSSPGGSALSLGSRALYLSKRSSISISLLSLTTL